MGSYHFNITLPHIEDNIEIFKLRHINFAIALQYLEPLFLGVFGNPDPESIGSIGSKTQSSFRLFNSASMFINSTNIKDYNFSPGRNNDVPNDFLQRRPKEEQESLKQINLTNTTNLLSIIGEPIKTYNFKLNDNSIGADIRSTAKDGEKQRISDWFGFEFRLMDYFPIENVKQFAEFLWLIAFYIEHKQVNIKTSRFNPVTSSVVKTQISNIIKIGWNTIPSVEFITEFKSALNLEDTIVFDLTNVYTFLNSIYKYFINYYNLNIAGTSNNIILNMYYDILGSQTVKDLPNINKQMKDKIINSLITKKIADLKTNPSAWPLCKANFMKNYKMLCILSKQENERINQKSINEQIKKILNECFGENFVLDYEVDNFRYYFDNIDCNILNE